MARKKYDNNPMIDAQLEQVSQMLDALQVSEATDLLNSVAPVSDYDGDVDGADYNTWRASYGKVTVLKGSGADGNYDDVVDAADYTVWRDSTAALGNGQLAHTVPEPSALWRSWRQSRFSAASCPFKRAVAASRATSLVRA